MLYKLIPNNNYKERIYLPKGFKNLSENKISAFNKIFTSLNECNICTCIDPELNNDEIKLSDDVIKSLSIPPGLSYQIYCAGKTICLGPVLGLLLDKNDILTEKHLKKYLPYTFLYNKIGGLLYVFSLEGINYDTQFITGFYYNPDISYWEKAILPFPQSIFRRIPLSKDTIRKLQKATDGRMFNNTFFDKWKFWNIANKYPSLIEHLPNTQLLQSLSDIDDMFNSFDTLFLKPKKGTLGKGLVRVEKINAQYLFTERDIKKPALTCNKEEAITYINDINKRQSKYIIQQNIDLLKFEDRYSDFRFILQKDNTRKWQCTGMVVSMGESGGICSNYPNSCYVSFEEFFIKYLNWSKKKIAQKKQEIIALCIKFCELLDAKMGNYGDVGFDIGIDNMLKPWVLEINEMHYHIMPLLINDYKTFLEVKKNPIKYAASLSGFKLFP